MERPDDRLLHQWHVQINRHHDRQRESGVPWKRWMYMAKDLADEVPRMVRLFAAERRGELAKRYVHCHHAACGNTPQALADNHLKCSLGVECRTCPHLLALEGGELTPEQLDYARAWTCAAHILAETQGEGDRSGEGWLQTVDDRMYWSRLHANLAADDPDDVSVGA